MNDSRERVWRGEFQEENHWVAGKMGHSSVFGVYPQRILILDRVLVMLLDLVE